MASGALRTVAVEAVGIGDCTGHAEVAAGVHKMTFSDALYAIRCIAACQTAIICRKAAQTTSIHKVVLTDAQFAGSGAGARGAGWHDGAAQLTQISGRDEVVLVSAGQTSRCVGAFPASFHVFRAHPARVAGVHVLLDGAALDGADGY